ncbi:MAG: M20 family metallopeptidase [Bacteroidales bacterium]|nr:M20 family metallopeptidase [Bacteroidales bacterium]
MILRQIKELSARYFSDTVTLRRYLHQHPELSFHEANTAALVSRKLQEYGIPHQKDVSGHGLVALIEGRNPQEQCVGLRADLDALPIDEQASHSYISLNKGVMHACGHDAHTAMLLSAGRILNDLKKHFTGSVKLLFQPAEEKLPGGALGMIEAGVLHNPDVLALTGQHVLPTLDAGKVGFRTGAFMASTDEITILIRGKGGHAAMPDQINDTVLIASQVVVALQQIVSRMAPPLVPTVLSFGRMIANGAYNIIPDEVLIQGTFRTFDESWRAKAKEHIRQIATHTAAAAGANAVVEIQDGYPVLINDKKVTLAAIEAAKAYLGEENVILIDQRMTAEDFAWYTHAVPSCFYRIGTANASKGISSGLHTPQFDIDEAMLEHGSGLMAWIAISQLAE